MRQKPRPPGKPNDACLIADAITAGEVLQTQGDKWPLRANLNLKPDRFHEMVTLIDRYYTNLPREIELQKTTQGTQYDAIR